MSETNALAEGAASTSDEETKNPQPSPETTPASQTSKAREGDEPTKAEGDEKAETDSKKARAPSERIRQLIQERNEAEVRAHVAEQKLRSLKRPLQAKEGMTEIQRQALEIRQADREGEAEEVAATVEEARAEMKSARLQLFSEKVGDQKIVDAFCSLPRVSEELADLVAESDMAAELAAKLSNDPKEARRLSLLSPHRLGAEIARMERALEAQPNVRRVSNAPEPSGTRLRGGSSPAAKAITDPSLSMEDYAERRKAEMRKAAQR